MSAPAGRSRRPDPMTESLWELLGAADRTRLQNGLMRIPDKVCAVALGRLDEERRRTLYASIAGPKAARIEEEIRLESRRRTSEAVRAKIIQSFLAQFGGAGGAGVAIHIKPKRRE